MKNKIHWINRKQHIGIITDANKSTSGAHSRALQEALEECPVKITWGFDIVTEQEYDDTVLDLRYEEGEWQQ